VAASDPSPASSPRNHLVLGKYASRAQVFDEPVHARVDVHDAVAVDDAEIRAREDDAELPREVARDRGDGVGVVDGDALRLFVLGSVHVRHEDGSSAALDDVVQRRERRVDAKRVFELPALHAVVIHAHEDDLAGEVRVLDATEMQRGVEYSIIFGRGRGRGRVAARRARRPRAGVVGPRGRRGASSAAVSRRRGVAAPHRRATASSGRAGESDEAAARRSA
jgi:hypothetical protein